MAWVQLEVNWWSHPPVDLLQHPQVWLGHCTLLTLKSLDRPPPLHSCPLPQLPNQPNPRPGPGGKAGGSQVRKK